VRRTVLTLTGLTLGGVLLSGCGGGSTVKAAPDAADPGCAALVARLPSTVLGRTRRTLDVKGAAQWGDPAIVLRCGVAVPGPTTDPCSTVDDVDWVQTQSKKYYEFTSFGRSPATEVLLPVALAASGESALVDLNDAVGSTRKTTLKCQ
jgi:hypothetical protein